MVICFSFEPNQDENFKVNPIVVNAIKAAL